MIVRLAEWQSWTVAVGIALAGHGLVLAGVLWLRASPRTPPPEEPVVLVELPPPGGAVMPVSSVAETAPSEPRNAPSQPIASPLDAPPLRVPLPRDAIVLPPVESVVRPTPKLELAPQPSPTAHSTQDSSDRAATAAGPRPSESAGQDPKAKREQADYYALLSAHLNRRKHYPAAAKKARQQGVVTVRFTVRADGSISASSIRKSSGHAVLDQATLDLMQRVAPLPKFPKSMTRESVTISLPIDYSLITR